MPNDVRGLPRLAETLGDIETEEYILHRFPKKKSTTGTALKYVLAQVSSLLKKEYPCVYKIGFTHSLKWRWCNKLYGYKFDRDKYEVMVGLFMSAHPIGAALMEAFLINQYQGNSPCNMFCKRCFGLLVFRPAYEFHYHVTPTLLSSGSPGCRNERSGGDSIADENAGGPFFTYIVYRRLKNPPPLPPAYLGA